MKMTKILGRSQQLLTIHGSGFNTLQSINGVSVGKSECEVMFVDDTEIRCNLLPHQAGKASITVSNGILQRF